MAAHNNIAIPDDLLAQADMLARAEGRTIDELAAEALKRYVDTQQMVRELDELSSWGERHARERGFEPPDVERAISDLRQGR